ncbi:MAG: hypothetical protein ACK6DZ_08810 [Acidobacteriota bacterium]
MAVLLRWLALFLVAIVLAYEELQWRLAPVYALLGRLPILHQLETAVTRLPPYGALACFALPSVFLFPLKLLALFWLGGGYPMLGLSTIVAAKVAGTALVARIFQLTRPALLTIAWVRWIYNRVIALRAAAYQLWRSLPLVRWARQRWRRLKETVARRLTRAESAAASRNSSSTRGHHSAPTTPD